MSEMMGESTSGGDVFERRSKFKVGVTDYRMIIVNSDIYKVILNITEPKVFTPNFNILLEDELEDLLGRYLTCRTEFPATKIHTASFHVDIELFPWWRSDELKSASLNGKQLSFVNTEYLFKVRLCPKISQNDTTTVVTDKHEVAAVSDKCISRTSDHLSTSSEKKRRSRLSFMLPDDNGHYGTNGSSGRSKYAKVEKHDSLPRARTVLFSGDSAQQTPATQITVKTPKTEHDYWSPNNFSVATAESRSENSHDTFMTPATQIVDVETIKTETVLSYGLDSSDPSPMSVQEGIKHWFVDYSPAIGDQNLGGNPGYTSCNKNNSNPKRLQSNESSYQSPMWVLCDGRISHPTHFGATTSADKNKDDKEGEDEVTRVDAESKKSQKTAKWNVFQNFFKRLR